MEDNITLEEYKRDKKSISKKKNGLLVVFLVILLVSVILISGFIGRHFMNIFIFTLMFSFPILILYRVQIANKLPTNIANWIVDETEEIEEEAKYSAGDFSYPLYVKEYQMLVLGILGMILSVYMLYKRSTEFVGIMASLFFAVTAGIIMMEKF